MKNKFWNWTTNLTDDENTLRILRIDGVIDDWKCDIEDNLTTPKEFREELNSTSGDIQLYINSPGGNIFAAAEIYSMLKEYSGGKITVKIPSFAASAATIIAMAGDTVEVSLLAILCIHNPFLDWVWGEEKDMIQAANYLAELKENIINAYELKTKLPRQQISDLMDAETYMNAKKAVELHFADKIMFDDEEENEVEELKAEMYSNKQAVNSLLGRFKNAVGKKDYRVDALNNYKKMLERGNLL